jgi:ABC-type uncharacterized transport system substrate-binding protein
MRRIGLAVVLTLSLFAAPRAAHAQQVRKVSRIGYLALGLRPVPGADPTFDAFLQGLPELGHVEGRNVALEIRYAEGRNERFPTLAAELVNLKVDVLIAESTPAAIAAKQASSTVPVVMVSVGDPVGAKLIDSLAIREATSQSSPNCEGGPSCRRSSSHAAKQVTWTWNLSSPGLSPSRANSISNSS